MMRHSLVNISLFCLTAKSGSRHWNLLPGFKLIRLRLSWRVRFGLSTPIHSTENRINCILQQAITGGFAILPNSLL